MKEADRGKRKEGIGVPEREREIERGGEGGREREWGILAAKKANHRPTSRGRV